MRYSNERRQKTRNTLSRTLSAAPHHINNRADPLLRNADKGVALGLIANGGYEAIVHMINFRQDG